MWVFEVAARRRALGSLLRAGLGLGLLSGLAACGDPDIRRGDDALGMGRYAEAIGAYRRDPLDTA